MSSDITLAHIHGLLENFSKNVYRAKDSDQGTLVSITYCFSFAPFFFLFNSVRQFQRKQKNDIFHDRFMIYTIRVTEEINKINGEEIKTKPNDEQILAYKMQITILNQQSHYIDRHFNQLRCC